MDINKKHTESYSNFDLLTHHKMIHTQQDQISASSEFIHDQKRHNLKCMFVDTGHIASHRETDEGKDGGRRYVQGGRGARNGGNAVS